MRGLGNFLFVFAIVAGLAAFGGFLAFYDEGSEVGFVVAVAGCVVGFASYSGAERLRDHTDGKIKFKSKVACSGCGQKRRFDQSCPRCGRPPSSSST